ncbi:hypothetical protein C2S52_022226 [Perilla frutescens var. hirtella]|uniref:Uncharacterized protein n=1 Tax=Perilla frutescens var. hirtella TaxID=608512 RepID=A0AAD4JGK0_PERFH|nr:hypothetical protein C2S52_022226 [Perilla frutescens var. hirtella]KAH6807380.1 hypothetical protein C2S51_028488 [Perilla frutescens var. frutescens]KAH6833377.1 hypothetical protein C2S53_007182 [Perilla frutescens var. hirtella]
MQKGSRVKGKDLMLKCRTDSAFLTVKYFIKKVSKYLSYLISCRIRPWMTSYATKSGHFSVITTGNGESKKFLIGLRFLSYPPFVRLLEAAEREFGFEQKGVLTLPCEASELQQILSHV